MPVAVACVAVEFMVYKTMIRLHPDCVSLDSALICRDEQFVWLISSAYFTLLPSSSWLHSSCLSICPYRWTCHRHPLSTTLLLRNILRKVISFTTSLSLHRRLKESSRWLKASQCPKQEGTSQHASVVTSCFISLLHATGKTEISTTILHWWNGANIMGTSLKRSQTCSPQRFVWKRRTRRWKVLLQSQLVSTMHCNNWLCQRTSVKVKAFHAPSLCAIQFQDRSMQGVRDITDK